MAWWTSMIPVATNILGEVFGNASAQGAPQGGGGPRAGSAPFGGGWLGEFLTGFVQGLLGLRGEAATGTIQQTFPQPQLPQGGQNCGCGGPFGIEPWLKTPPETQGGVVQAPANPAPAPVVPGPVPSAPEAQTPTGFDAEVRGQQPQEIDLTLARLSQDVYTVDSTANIDGWQRVETADLAAAGITPEMLEDPETGFRAAVYTNGEGQYVVAFAGTNPTQIPDWLANFGQGLGLETQQYEQARELGQLMDAAFGDNVIFTGHSLGGGLASLAALETGNAAVTFNAAGLHDTTIRSTGLDPEGGRHQAAEGQIRAYRVDGDLLTDIQENGRLASIAPDAVGHPIELGDPHGFWDHVLNPIRWWDVSHGVELHLMGSVLDALQQDQPWQ